MDGRHLAPWSALAMAALFAATGVIFSAVYALTLYRSVMFGEITNPAMKAITDVDRRELLIFAPLIIGTDLRTASAETLAILGNRRA